MRIILVQSEIELAIRQFVLSQIAIRDGQEITIDFKNTRGPEGATAEIDIKSPAAEASASGNSSSAGSPVAAASTTQTPSSEPKEEGTVAENPTGTSAPAAEATASDTSEESGSAQNATQSSNVEIGEDIKKTVPFDADEPVDGGDEAQSEPAPRSLFANLTKPKND